jgi:hypothetical protein
MSLVLHTCGSCQHVVALRVMLQTPTIFQTTAPHDRLFKCVMHLPDTDSILSESHTAPPPCPQPQPHTLLVSENFDQDPPHMPQLLVLWPSNIKLPMAWSKRANGRTFTRIRDIAQ